MPQWFQHVSELVNTIGLVSILVWTYTLGRELGRLKEKVDAHEKKIEANDRQTLACTALFRQISNDVSSLNAKIDILLDHFNKEIANK